MKPQNCNLVITIPDTGIDANVAMVKPDGTLTQKTVLIDDIVSNLASSFKFSTGMLPRGTRFFSGSGENYIIAIEMGDRVRRMVSKSKQKKIINIPFPKCFFVFWVEANRIKQTYVFSLKNPINAETDTLYNFPFGNVYQDGHVCWGEAKLPKINCAMELVGVINIFLGSGFNGDLIEGWSFGQPKKYEEGECKVKCFWTLLKYLENKTIFPREMLKTSPRTLQKIINSGE
jgi:hypothetical protein